jgi:deazaflavin-dependent oxidoreductase (nitroreductase family)
VHVDPFFSRLNPLIGAVLRSPFHPLLSAGLVLLTVTGRRSGRRYSIPVGYQRRGDELVILVSHADRKQWWRNYRTPGPVELRLRGRHLNGEASVVAPESPHFRERLEASFRRMPWLGRQFGVRFDAKSGLSGDQLGALRTTSAVVQVSLQQTDR